VSQRGDSLFHAFATRLAQRLAGHGPHREAEYLTWVSVIYSVAADCFGGERIYGPQTNRVEREQARARIAMALEAGEPAEQIARREGTTPRTVRRIRGQLRP
jgi:DNA invertase Pin-like site-specific DNA recombinase